MTANIEPLEVFRTFRTSDEARQYRATHGAGGWIFEPDDGGTCTLFPPSMPPASIFHHPLTAGQSGRLLAA